MYVCVYIWVWQWRLEESILWLLYDPLPTFWNKVSAWTQDSPLLGLPESLEIPRITQRLYTA